MEKIEIRLKEDLSIKNKNLWIFVSLLAGTFLFFLIIIIQPSIQEGQTGDLISGTVGVALGFVALYFISNALTLQSQSTTSDILARLESRLFYLLDRLVDRINTSGNLRQCWKSDIEPLVNKLAILDGKTHSPFTTNLIYDFDVKELISQSEEILSSDSNQGILEILYGLTSICKSVEITLGEIKKHDNKWDETSMIPTFPKDLTYCLSWNYWKNKQTSTIVPNEVFIKNFPFSYNDIPKVDIHIEDNPVFPDNFGELVIFFNPYSYQKVFILSILIQSNNTQLISRPLNIEVNAHTRMSFKEIFDRTDKETLLNLFIEIPTLDIETRCGTWRGYLRKNIDYELNADGTITIIDVPIS